MKRVSDHLSEILSTVRPLPEISLQLLEAHGCVLVEDVVSPWPLPQFDNSSMDGYAVRAEDVAEATAELPVELPVTADIAAGDTGISAIGPGISARIMTGAPMPSGADAVVPVEQTDGGTARVMIFQAPRSGQFIRHIGGDVAEGEVVVTAGTTLTAPQIGLLAAVGRDRAIVRPKPRVVVISTGSELVEPGRSLKGGQIIDSNSFTLATAAVEAGAVAYRIPAVPDDKDRLLSLIEEQLVRADLVITSGGVSAGAYDVVKEVLSGRGTMRFDSVAMQPGKPQGFGTLDRGEGEAVPTFTLPGNPVSAFVSFEVFVRPAIKKMLGASKLHRPTVKAVLQQPLRSPEGRRQFARAQLTSGATGTYTATPLSGQQSHLLAGLAAANALVVVPEQVTEIPAGQMVDALVLDNRRD
jgi:molybdopterin molybdotransferase